MNQQHKTALGKCLVLICERLEITEVITVLRCQGILNDVQCQIIQKPGSISYEQNRALVFTLINSGSSKAFEYFISSLKHSNQGTLASEITDYYSKLKSEQAAFLTNALLEQKNYRKLEKFQVASSVLPHKVKAFVAQRFTVSGRTFSSDRNGFCVLPGKQIGLIYTKPIYMLVNLSTGENTEVEMENRIDIAHNVCCGMHTLVRNSKTFILSIIINSQTNKCLVVSHALDSHKISFVDEQCLGFVKAFPRNWATIQENEAGDIYCFIDLADIEMQSKNNTVFSAIKIVVDDNGKIWLKIMVKDGILNGLWYAPFLHMNVLYWLPKNSTRDEKYIKLLHVTMEENPSNRFGEVVILPNEVRFDAEGHYPFNEMLVDGCQNPVVIGDNIFYYVYSEEHNDGQLLYISVSEKRFQMLPIDMKGSAIQSKGAGLTAASIDNLFLNGLPRSSNTGYVYRIEIDELTPSLKDLTANDLNSLNSLPYAVQYQEQSFSDGNENFEANRRKSNFDVRSNELVDLSKVQDQRSISILQKSTESRTDISNTIANQATQASAFSSTSKMQTIIKKRLNGYDKPICSCVLPNEGNALSLVRRDEYSSSGSSSGYTSTNFVQIELYSGKYSRIIYETESSKEINNDYCYIHAVVRTSKTFILSFLFEGLTKQCFVVSHLIGNFKTTIVDEHFIGVDGDGYRAWANIQENEIGEIYCIVDLADLNMVSKTKTLFHAVQIFVDDSGKIRSKILVKNCPLDGFWYAPFVHSNAFYWLPFDTLHAGSLLKIVLKEDSSRKVNVISELVEVDVATDIPPTNYMLRTDCQNPVVKGNNIFYYAFSYKENYGQLLHLDLVSKCWQTLSLDMKDKAIQSHGAGLKAVPNGCLFLHGHTLNKENSNEEKEYLFVFEIDGFRSQLNRNTPETSKNEEQNPLESLLQAHQKTDMSTITYEKSWAPSENYEQKEKLGSGAYGVVYRCWDPIAQKIFVAKHTHIQSDHNMEIARNEVKQLQNCRHPKLITYFGCKVKTNAIIIFMEYMPVGSLLRYITELGPLIEQEAVKYIVQILEGLTYMHKKGIVHSDLKCDNLLLDGKGNLKICDFGIAIQKRLNTMNRSYFFSNVKGGGTYHWTAPEVLMQTAGCSRSSDVWSLACSIVEMLTEEPPYSKMLHAEFMGSLFGKSLSYDPELLTPKASCNMKRFLAQLFKLDVNERPKHADDVVSLFSQEFDP